MENKMSLMLPKAIIFDWDSTLAITRPAVVAAFNQVLAEYGLPEWQEMKSLRREMCALKDDFAIFFKDREKEAYRRYLDVYDMELTEANDGAEEFLRLCEVKGIKKYIISNKERSLLMGEIERCFKDIHFERVLAYGDAKANKPAAEPVFEVLENAEFPINKQNVWLIGDSKPDVECAYNAHVQAVLLGANIKDEVYLRDKENLVNVADFFSLAGMLRRL